MVINNYSIENNNRLQYKRIINKKEVWLNIPYENEVEPLLNYIHHNNVHIKTIECKFMLLNMVIFGLIILRILLNVFKFVVNVLKKKI